MNGVVNQINFVNKINGWFVENVDIDVGVKVEINQVGELINEWVERVQIEQIKIDFPVPEDDPGFV